MVNVSNRIDLAACLGTDALLGSPMGEVHFPLLLGAILRYPAASVVVLDFSGITNMTASYLAATLVRLLRMIPSGSLDRYVVITGISDADEREIAYVLNHEGTPVILRSIQGEHRIIGPLDNAYVTTLHAVMTSGSVTARGLQATSNETIGQTGWIKRLTTLHTLGLVKRTRTGREYAYHPITTEELHG